ncbi:ABC transporter ATP-binding protein [Paenibacillus chitinolyticus]|uniref:ABC transporter ATP-binding protein n=1 Tax=Paenibacillus chitinolyticus TaxID=79263 RepID=UPI0036D900C1
MNIKYSFGKKLPMMEIYFWILSYLKPFRLQMLGVICLNLSISVALLLVPKYTEYFIDKVIPSLNPKLFLLAFSSLVLIVLYMIVANIILNYLNKIVQEKTIHNLQLSLIEKLFELGFSYYERNAVGNTFSLFNNEVNAAQQLYRQHFPMMIQSLISFIVSTVILLNIKYEIVIIVICCFISYYFIAPYFLKKTDYYAKKEVDYQARYNKKVYDSMSALLELKSYSTLDWDRKNLFLILKEYNVNIMKRTMFWFLRWFSRKFTISLGIVITVIYSIYLYTKNEITIGEFTAIFAIYFAVMDSLIGFLTAIMEQRLQLYQIKRIYDFAKQEPEVNESENFLYLNDLKGAISIQDVSFRYSDKNQTILKNINLEIKAGEKVAFVGKSGHGKTTLIKLIGRFYDASDGSISIDNIPVNRFSFEQLRLSVGYVFQETFLLSGTVYENIRLGNPNVSEDQIKKAAIAANAHEFIEALPHKYNTKLGENAVILSGGQKQRIAIARMLVKDPKIIILDEATSALDNKSEREVQEALDELFKGRTVIAVAHRLTTIMNFDKLCLIHNGEIIETGTYTELINKKGYFYELATGDILFKELGK